MRGSGLLCETYVRLPVVGRLSLSRKVGVEKNEMAGGTRVDGRTIVRAIALIRRWRSTGPCNAMNSGRHDFLLTSMRHSRPKHLNDEGQKQHEVGQLAHLRIITHRNRFDGLDNVCPLLYTELAKSRASFGTLQRILNRALKLLQSEAWQGTIIDEEFRGLGDV